MCDSIYKDQVNSPQSFQCYRDKDISEQRGKKGFLHPMH